jgi:hypothetical protein
MIALGASQPVTTNYPPPPSPQSTLWPRPGTELGGGGGRGGVAGVASTAPRGIATRGSGLYSARDGAVCVVTSRSVVC